MADPTTAILTVKDSDGERWIFALPIDPDWLAQREDEAKPRRPLRDLLNVDRPLTLVDFRVVQR